MRVDLGLAIAAPGCGDPVGHLTECGLVCPARGIAEGNASISGIVSVDAFFAAAIDVRDAATNVSGTVRAKLEGIAASLEIPGYADLSIADLAAAVELELAAKFEANLQGGLTIIPPEVSVECEASVDAKARASVICTPPSLSVGFQFADGLDAQAQAEFEIWLHGFDGRFATMLTRVPDLQSCGPDSYYIANDTIVLCPETCALVQGDFDAEIDMEYLCIDPG